jgi:2-C-methyl-D-erythritol 4-phosphate cytidylyltransferase/2-C-methyl-D-erythritol 2,4-cyclodiphosphate synthase
MELGGKPVLLWSIETFLSHPRVEEVILVGSANLDQASLPSSVRKIQGGSTRAESSRKALEAVSSDVEYLLVHDAARPFVSHDLIDRVIEGLLELGASAPAIPVSDTIRNTQDGLTLVDRAHLIAMQTPQGARVDLLRQANYHPGATDEMSQLDIEWKVVAGDQDNFKITTQADYIRAQRMVNTFPEYRTGLGYDVHRFSSDPARPLWLGGVHFPGSVGLEGHSDADALLHAAVDALLGAAALGDIGQHFPPTDARWKDEPSLTFLRHAKRLLTDAGWTIVNLDLAVVAEAPKLMPRSGEIREAIANALEIGADRVSLKATTNEGLGAIGRKEGIAAFATATIRKP